jgi:LysR family transcriptional regulator, benzoate and cis,cis-muconate-responsive activator of ben and cat genes
MELHQMRYFTSVARDGSFTKAAKRLNMAQPPLSRHIHQLEQRLGVKLFERGRRPLRLTEAGRFVYEHALGILDRAESIDIMTRKVGQIESGQLGIGFVSSVLYGPLPDLVRRFQATYPDLRVDMVELSSVEQVSALKEGRIDVGFGRLHVDDPTVQREVLTEEPLVAALPISHPLLDRLGPLSSGDLSSQMLIIYPSNAQPSYADEVLSILEQRGIVGNINRRVRDVQTALGLVAAGVGITLVPTAISRLPWGNVVYRPLQDPGAKSPVIMFRRGRDDSRKIAALLPFVREGYRPEGDISVLVSPDV